jgi:hypothetical protein
MSSPKPGNGHVAIRWAPVPGAGTYRLLRSTVGGPLAIGIVLVWKPVPGATGYVIYRSTATPPAFAWRAEARVTTPVTQDPPAPNSR